MAATTAAAEPQTAPAAKGKGKLVLFIALGVLLAGGGAGAWWWSTHSSAKPAVAHTPPPAAPPLYLPLDPPFVVNFESEQAVRFLQITVQLMSRDPQTIELLKSNDPMVRDRLLMLFGNQKYTVLSTREGKEGLRQQALQSVGTVLAGAGGHPDRLEAVYFTSFVMQ